MRDIGEARIAVDGTDDVAAATFQPAGRTGTPSTASAPRPALLWSAAIALAAAAGYAGWSLRPASSFALDALTVAVPVDITFPPSANVAAVSPDGRHLVYVALRGTAKQLYHRPLDQLDAVPIPDTEGAASPFFSPDGEWIGFTIDEDAASRTDHSTTIKKVSLVGGPSQTVCDLPDPRTMDRSQTGLERR